MDKQKLIQYVLDSDIFKRWHWFRYHFTPYRDGYEHPFAKAILDSLLKVNHSIDGFAIHMVDRLASISGKEKSLHHYDQLLQTCSEIYVLRQAVSYFGEGAVFEYEPHVHSKKNPEVNIKFGGITVGIEVKQPALIKTDHIKKRNLNPIQLLTRQDFNVSKMGVTKPRDNPVKDFFISADEKFKGFHQVSNYYGVLFIVWDDFINEPISAILGKPSGLFLEGSFAKDDNGDTLQFKNVNAVIIDRHLSNLINASADRKLLDNKEHAMDYGHDGQFPFKVIIQNPVADPVPMEVVKCFQAYEPHPTLGGEYIPQELVIWSQKPFKL